ncbi:uncharacterized protein LOC135145122 [Zophobas morio]|uniref:uncharacterized protein LOC135145122 n=1 Tax=Zophobas morio TaxID=2755281 RepID=UPI003083B043
MPYRLTKIFYTSLGLGILHLFFLVTLIAVIIWFRKTQAVISRGTVFLCHLCLSLIGAIVISVYYTKTRIDQVSKSNIGDAKNTSYKVAILLAFFFGNYLSAIAIRMRLIYEIFYSKSKRSFHPLLNHFKYYYIDLVIYAVAMLPAALKIYGIVSRKLQVVGPFLLIPIYYSLVIGFFTYKCRNIATEFSDYRTNLRSSGYCCVAFLIVIIIYKTVKTLVAATVWQMAIESIGLVYGLDSLLELTFLELSKRKRARDREKTRGGTNGLSKKTSYT